MVPDGWTQSELKSLVQDGRKISYGIVQPGDFTPGGVILIRGKDYSRGWVEEDEFFRVSLEIDQPYRRSKVRADDILLTIVGEYTGNTAVVPDWLAGANITQTTARIAIDPNKASPSFLYQYLSGRPGKREVYRFKKGGAQPGLNIGDVERFQILLPPVEEQRKIAEILSTWDKAIETTEKLLANAKAQKQVLMQQLLTGKRRLNQFKGGKWRPFRLDELAHINPRTDRTSRDIVTFLPMEAVSNGGQILARHERKVAELGSGYTVFAEGDVLVAKITPCFENGKGCHATGLSSGMGLGSTEFHVLRARKSSDQRLLFHIVNSYDFRKRGEANMTGSAGQRRVPADYIKQYTVQLPEDVSAREMIGSVMDNAMMISMNSAAYIERLKSEKRGLMQVLLTGRRRVIV